jgi:hypothetical protein
VPEVRRPGVERALKGSGVRAPTRVVRISPTTVSAGLKKSRRAATRSPHGAASLLVPRPPRPGGTRR